MYKFIVFNETTKEILNFFSNLICFLSSEIQKKNKEI